MKGTIRIKNLKKKAAYYQVKSYDEAYGGDFTFFIEPLLGTEDKCFYYAKRLEDGYIEITGEAYIISRDDSLVSHKKDAKKEIGNKYPAYYWLDDNDKVIEKTYE